MAYQIAYIASQLVTILNMLLHYQLISKQVALIKKLEKPICLQLKVFLLELFTKHPISLLIF